MKIRPLPLGRSLRVLRSPQNPCFLSVQLRRSRELFKVERVYFSKGGCRVLLFQRWLYFCSYYDANGGASQTFSDLISVPISMCKDAPIRSELASCQNSTDKNKSLTPKPLFHLNQEARAHIHHHHLFLIKLNQAV